MNVTTWNMQGSNATTEVKWQTGIANMLANARPQPDFLCLQECGPPPPSATFLGGIAAASPAGAPTQIDVYHWGGTQTRGGNTVVFHYWDVAGGRVNTAIVARGLLDQPACALIWPAGGPTHRPALGLQVGDGWIFSYHAISPGGIDAQATIAEVANSAVNAGAAWWLVAGDFNSAPYTFQIPVGSDFCEPDGPTHSVQNPISTYDYCVASWGPDVVGARVGGMIMSDHYAVAYSL